LSTFGNFVIAALGVVALFFGQYQLGVMLIATAYGREEQESAAQQAKYARQAALRDRYQMVRSGVGVRSIVYGRARVSGPIAYAQSTGTKKEYLQLVVCLAGHESDAIETVLFNDVMLPAEDGSGNINSGEFSRIDVIGAAENNITVSPHTVAHTPFGTYVVTRNTWSIDVGVHGGYYSEVLVEGVGFTRAGSQFTIIGGMGTEVVINYGWQSFTPKVRIRKFLGTAAQAASSELVTECTPKWTSNHKLGSITYLYARLQYDQTVFGQVGVPNVSAVVRGKKVYDPRLDSTVPGGVGAHRVATPSTWTWSENPALCVGDFLRDATYGMGAAAAEVPALEIFAAADVCDALVTIYSTGTVTVTNNSMTVVGVGTSWLSRVRPRMNFIGPNAATLTVFSVTDDTHLLLTLPYSGTTLGGQNYTIKEKRYMCNGALSSDRSARDNLNSLLQSMSGLAAWVQGRWLVLAGAHTASVLAITEDMLAGEGIDIESTAKRRDLFNRIVPTYAEAEKLYTSTQAPSVKNATYLAADGGLDLPVEVTYDMVTGGVTAQRLAKIFLERSRQALTVSLSCNMRAYNVAPGEVVDITIARYGWSAKLFIVLKRTVDLATMQVQMVCRETASGVWDWNTGNETAVDLTPNTDLPSPFTEPAALASLVADSSLTYALFTGNSSAQTRVRLSWTQSTDIFVVQGGSIEIQVKNDAAQDWQQMPTVSGNSTETYLVGLQANRALIIRVRPVNSRGRAGPYTSIGHVPQQWFSPGTIGGGNILRNSSFEQDSNADGLADGWVAIQTGTHGAITNTLPSTGVNLGKAQRADVVSLGSDNGADLFGFDESSSPYLPITTYTGEKFTISCWFALSAQMEMYIQVFWFNDALNTLGTTSVTIPNPTAVPLRRASGVVAAPAAATRYLARFWCGPVGPDGTRGVANAAMLLDCVQLERGEVVTEYAPRTDELLSSQFGGVTLGGGNVIANSSFEKWTGIGDGPPQVQGLGVGWTAYSYGTTGTVTRTIGNTGGLNNGKYQRIAAAGLQTGDLDIAGVYASDVPIVAWVGSSVTFSAYLRADDTTAKLRLYVIFFDGAYSQLGSVFDSTPFTPTTVLRRYSVSGVVPANAAYARGFVWMQQRSSLGASAFDVDAVQLELGSVLTAYAPKPGEVLVRTATTGQALNFDPDCTSEDEWTGAHPLIARDITGGVTGTTALRSSDIGTSNHMYAEFSRSVPVDRLKAYRVSALIRKGGGANAGTAYLGLMGWDADGTNHAYDPAPHNRAPYAVYGVAVTSLTTSFVRHTTTITQATIAALHADITFIAPHCIPGYAAGSINGWVEMQDVRLEEVTATGTLDDLAVTAGKIANLAVTTAKIDNAAITTAKIGNLQVTSAVIADLTVGTTKITGNAVTQTVSGSSSGSAYSDEYNLQTKTTTVAIGTITTSTNGDGKVLILTAPSAWSTSAASATTWGVYGAACTLSGGAVSYGDQLVYTFRLKRGSTVIASTSVSGSPSNGDFWWKLAGWNSFSDTPGAGATATYYFEIETYRAAGTTRHIHECLGFQYALLETRK